MSAATESQGNVEKALHQEHRGLTKPREKSAAATARTTRNHFRTRTSWIKYQRAPQRDSPFF